MIGSTGTRVLGAIGLALALVAIADIESVIQRRRLEASLERLSGDSLPPAELQAARTQAALDVEASQTGRRAILILTLVGLVIAAAAGLRTVRRLNQPLNDLATQLQRLANGDRDLSNRITVDGPEEIAAFGRSVNAMLDTLLGVVGRARGSGSQLTSSVTALAASSKELEATVSEQAASTNQVVSSAKGISSTAQALVTTMDEVAALSLAAATSAGDGYAGLSRMSDTMRHMELASRSISEKLEVINGRANNITGVVTAIAKIADQTNLLSLNAAIEAAKAGEAGEGFTVVAREIRRLADQTAVATLDIERMVREMQGAVSAGVMGMEKFTDEVKRAVQEVERVGGQFTHIIEQVQGLTPRFESVTRGMETQSTGAGQISEAMVQLSEATRYTADALRTSRRAIEQLNATAQDLEREFARMAAPG